MKRTAMPRGKPLVRTQPDTARLTIPIKKCKHCRTKFVPNSAWQAYCRAEDCAVAAGAEQTAKRERAEAKAKREQARLDRAKKEALLTRSDWIKKARNAVNRYCRLRDIAAGQGCITCGARPETRFGGAFDAGHWRSVGSAPQLQFWTSQIRLQCVKCNRYGGGRAVEYRMALVAERGEAWVQAIESANHTAKFSIDYLKRLTAIFAKKARRMEKRIGLQS